MSPVFSCSQRTYLDLSLKALARHEGPGTLIVHTSAPLMPLILSQLGRRVIDGKRVIGYWAWELPAAPRDWRIGVPFTHEIWVPSAFTASAIKPIAEGRPVRVRASSYNCRLCRDRGL